MQRDIVFNRDPMQLYRSKKDSSRRSVLSKYSTLDFIWILWNVRTGLHWQGAIEGRREEFVCHQEV